jgi:hypothetical protein
MPRLKKPRTAALDEVRISREADAAIIDHVDPVVSSTRLVLGPQVQSMSDGEILKIFNGTVRVRERAVAEYQNVVVEVPPGVPQVRYFDKGDQWVPRGQLLRCVVEDGGQGGEVTIWIDDREFTLHEFGRMLTTHSGWGMRIAFVPEERLHEDPTIKIRDPED